MVYFTKLSAALNKAAPAQISVEVILDTYDLDIDLSSSFYREGSLRINKS